jgi:diguanylate cyclase (GGDEF)-like protein
MSSTEHKPLDTAAAHKPDIFESESKALDRARAICASADAGAQDYRQSLGELIGHFERLMRQTRRMIGHSDRTEREMQALARQLEYRATHDALTGVFNRSAIIEQTCEVLARTGAVMIVLDIDHFKRVNDDFGHPAGDAVILGIVSCLSRVIGSQGVIGRVGGEEFTVLLPGFELDAAVRLAQTMCDAIAAHSFGDPVDRPITASFGLSANPPGSDFDTAYNQADAALYSAKRAGRNRVETLTADQASGISRL